MKNVTIAGRLGKDAVLRRTQSGDPVLSFSVATDDGYGQNKRTLWFDVSVWGKRGEALSDHLTKGSAVSVAGDLSTREYEGKTYLTVRANEVTLLGSRNEGECQNQSAQRQQSYADASGSYISDALDDEIPF